VALALLLALTCPSPACAMQFFFLKYVDPATYQILGNLKIVTTGLLLRLCLQRRLSLLQWMALLLLMVGATTSQVCAGRPAATSAVGAVES
jgi:drug/metabolite transporter (DMT)-like permease